MAKKLDRLDSNCIIHTINFSGNRLVRSFLCTKEFSNDQGHDDHQIELAHEGGEDGHGSGQKGAWGDISVSEGSQCNKTEIDEIGGHSGLGIHLAEATGNKQIKDQKQDRHGQTQEKIAVHRTEDGGAVHIPCPGHMCNQGNGDHDKKTGI